MYNSEFWAVFGGNKSFATKMIVGRKGEQPFLITDQTVSSRHCEITQLAEGKFHIKDLDSTNGTYVNGVGIIECDVTSSETVKLGENYQLDLQKCFQQVSPNAVFPERLRTIYNNYSDAKRNIVSSQKWGMTFRIIIPQICNMALNMILGNERSTYILGVIISLGVSVLVTAISDKSGKRMENLSNTFQQQYADGNCNKFLGNYSPDYIENNLKCICPNCKKPIK